MNAFRANCICAFLILVTCLSIAFCLSSVVLIAVGAEKSTELSKEFCEYTNCQISVADSSQDLTKSCQISATVRFASLTTKLNRAIDCANTPKWQQRCSGDAFCYKYEGKLYVNKPAEAMNLIYIGIAILILGICAMFPVCVVMLMHCNMVEFN
jgi:hypothetical protein